jgi:hypothetical protein
MCSHSKNGLSTVVRSRRPGLHVRVSAWRERAAGGRGLGAPDGACDGGRSDQYEEKSGVWHRYCFLHLDQAAGKIDAGRGGFSYTLQSAENALTWTPDRVIVACSRPEPAEDGRFVPGDRPVIPKPAFTAIWAPGIGQV